MSSSQIPPEGGINFDPFDSDCPLTAWLRFEREFNVDEYCQNPQAMEELWLMLFKEKVAKVRQRFRTREDAVTTPANGSKP